MRTKTTIAAILLLAGIATAQDTPIPLGAAGSIVLNKQADKPADPAITPAGPIVAGLAYDHTSSWGFAGQLFEPYYDIYDTFVVEDFVLEEDTTLSEFRSHAFGDGDLGFVTDVIAEVIEDDRSVLCVDCAGPVVLLRSIPGAGYFADGQAVTDFGGQCLPAGSYLIRWAARLDFIPHGQVFFFEQFGEHTHGRGEPNNAISNPTGCVWYLCWACINEDGLPTGVNFTLFGEAGDCDAPCQISPCGDIDLDGDSDADDFFLYIDMFASGDPCADIDQDNDIDAEDFFAYLDRFVNPC